MSLNEFDKDILFQEIQQIQNTLEASYGLTDLETGLAANENVEEQDQEESDEEPIKSIQSSNFKCKVLSMYLHLNVRFVRARIKSDDRHVSTTLAARFNVLCSQQLGLDAFLF